MASEAAVKRGRDEKEGKVKRMRTNERQDDEGDVITNVDGEETICHVKCETIQ